MSALLSIVLATAGPSTAAAQHVLDSLEPGHWMVLSENTLSDLDPCPASDCSYSGAEGQSGLVDDWVGAAFATGHGALGSLVIWGGGHGGYWGSEVYAFDVATRRWSRLTDPYPGGTCDESTGLYPDGSPCPAHTYDAVEYHPGTNSFVPLASETNHRGGHFDDRPKLFDLDARTWSVGCDRPDASGITGASSAYDAVRDLIWFVGAYNQRISSYDVDACAWTAYEQYNVDIDTVTAIDPGRDLLVTLDGRGTHSVVVHDLADPSAGPTTVETTGDADPESQGKNGFEWDPVTEAFVAWIDGASVFVLRAPDGDFRTEPWTWTRVDPAPTNTVVPVRNGNGTYGRFRYVPSKNVFILVSSTEGPVWAYRLSAEIPPPPADAGRPDPDAGAPGNDDAGEASGGDGGTTSPVDRPADPAGCGCRVTAASAGAPPLAWVVLGLALLTCALRRRWHLTPALVALALVTGCGEAKVEPTGVEDAGGGERDAGAIDTDAGSVTPDGDAGSGMTVDPSLPTLPAWVMDLPRGHWQPISENTLADVDPEDEPALNPNFEDSDGDGRSERNAPWHMNSGQPCVITCWNGGAFASGYGESGALLVYGGGHAGYAGSEVYAFDMATRRWERVTDPYADPSDVDREIGAYPDGSPLPPHTYDGVGYDPVTNAFVVMRGIDDNHSGTLEANLRIAHVLDLDTKEWRHSPLNPSGANLHGGSTAYDPNRGVFWQLGCYDSPLTAFDPRPDNGDGTYGTYESYAAFPTSIDNAAAVDPVHDLLVYTAFRSTETVSARFLDDPDRERVVLEQHGELPTYRGQNGWEWSNRLSGFVYWALGSDEVRSFTKDSDDREDLGWTWTLLTSPDNTVTPDVSDNDTGPYSRFQLAAYGDEEVAIVVNDVDGQVYAFRIP